MSDKRLSYEETCCDEDLAIGKGPYGIVNAMVDDMKGTSNGEKYQNPQQKRMKYNFFEK